MALRTKLNTGEEGETNGPIHGYIKGVGEGKKRGKRAVVLKSARFPVILKQDKPVTRISTGICMERQRFLNGGSRNNSCGKCPLEGFFDNVEEYVVRR